MLSATSLTMTSSALAGKVLAPDPGLATLPLGLTYLSVMISLIPVSLMMSRYGRRTGFVLGGISAVIAGVLMAMGIYQNIFLLFIVGSLFLGFAMATGQFIRFTAAEIATDEFKSRAISWVLAGGLLAAFVGPGIARVTQNIWSGLPFSASFASVSILGLGFIVVQFFLRLPTTKAEEIDGKKRSLTKILSQPVFIVAALGAMVAYGAMNLLMVATPLAMDSHQMSFSQTATVIQWHIVGMFLPSFFTGHLIHYFGVLKIMMLGALILIVCILVHLAGSSYLHFTAGLVLLGVGWNFLFVGGTTLLTESYLPAEKGIVQGINDFLVFSAVAFTAMTSGYLHHVIGWEMLNKSVIPFVGLAGIAIVFLAISRQQKSVLKAS